MDKENLSYSQYAIVGQISEVDIALSMTFHGAVNKPFIR